MESKKSTDLIVVKALSIAGYVFGIAGLVLAFRAFLDGIGISLAMNVVLSIVVVSIASGAAWGVPKKTTRPLHLAMLGVCLVLVETLNLVAFFYELPETTYRWWLVGWYILTLALGIAMVVYGWRCYRIGRPSRKKGPRSKKQQASTQAAADSGSPASSGDVAAKPGNNADEQASPDAIDSDAADPDAVRAQETRHATSQVGPSIWNAASKSGANKGMWEPGRDE